jgi:hypothetical protein
MTPSGVNVLLADLKPALHPFEKPSLIAIKLERKFNLELSNIIARNAVSTLPAPAPWRQKRFLNAGKIRPPLRAHKSRALISTPI